VTLAYLTGLTADTSEVLQAILDQSQDCVKLLSASGELEYMNANGQRAMAIDDFSLLLGRGWRSVWPEESRDLVDRAVRDAADGRTSRFDAYCPTLSGEPRWWDVSVSPIRSASGEVSHILATSRDISLQNAERQSERDRRARAEARAEMRDTVAREMRHRVKNLLAIVTSIGRLTARQRPKTEDFIGLFERRIGGLAAAQYLLVEHDDHRASLPALIDALIGTSERDDRIAAGEMPKVVVNDQAAQTIALVIGELLTNAHKYGALCRPGGQIYLTSERGDDRISFTWEEDCGAPIATPGAPGSGTLLMQRISAGQPEPVDIQWLANGMKATFAVAIEGGR
jgi:PAS domain S-box-containing protein